MKKILHLPFLSFATTPFISINLLAIIIFLSALRLPAQNLYGFLPEDTSYEIYNDSEKSDNNYKIILSPERKDDLATIIHYQKMLRQEYTRSFGWNVDEKVHYIFLSSRDQTPNAFATVIPKNTLAFYGGGAALADEFGSDSFITSTMVHESAHLYQLHPQSEGPKIHRNIFGHTFGFIYPFIPVPVFIFPNILLPQWIIEGNATFNESRFHLGGRLFSGYGRALLYTLLKNNRLDSNNLTNSTLDFPYGEDKYYVGAYFQNFLAQKFGTDKVNQFFVYHGQFWYNPFIINSAYWNYFGIGYWEAINEFIAQYTQEALKQTSSDSDPDSVSVSVSVSAPTILTTQMNPTFNADKEKIYFLSSADGKSPLKINIFDKASKRFTSSHMTDLPYGKLIELHPKEFYSAALGIVDKNKNLYSLWGKGHYHLQKYDSKLVHEFKNEYQLLYTDMSKSFDRPHLYLGDQFINTSDSAPLSDALGNVYYFKQEQDLRVLYRNKEKIASLNGYFAQLVDIDININKDAPPDQIYFLAPTEYGQSLFSYHFKQNKFYRLSKLDTIVEAKKIDASSFLIAELGPTSYTIKMIALPSQEELLPTRYSYPWEGKLTLDKTQEITTGKNQSLQTTNYDTLHEISFNSWNFFTRFMGDSYIINAYANFSDPLEYNFLSTTFSLSRKNISDHTEEKIFKNSKELNLNYTNKRQLLSWSLLATLEEATEKGPQTIHNKRYLNSKLGGELLYPFMREGYWHQSSTLHLDYSLHDKIFTKYVDIPLTYQRSFRLSLFPYQKLKIRPILFNENKKITSELTLNAEQDVGNENIFSFMSSARSTFNGSQLWGRPVIDSDLGQESPPTAIDVANFHPQKAFRIGVSYKKVINEGLYSSIIPLSLRRFAPEILYNHHFIDDHGFKTQNEYGLGLTTEFLLAHLAGFPASIYYLYNPSLEKNKQDQLIFQVNIGVEI